MTLTNRYYGGASLGPGRTIQDLSLCDLQGNFVYTARSRAKGLLTIIFFAPDAPASANALRIVQQWTQEIPTDKWSALGVAGPDRPILESYAQSQGITGITVLVDYDLYQTRAWGISHLPSTFVIDGKTGRVLSRVIGDDPQEFMTARQILEDNIAKIVAAEAAAKKAAEEKAAADAIKAAAAAAGAVATPAIAATPAPAPAKA